MISIVEYTLKQGLNDCSKIDYLKDKFDNIKYIDISKKNSIITVFNANKLDFTDNGSVTTNSTMSFLEVVYGTEIPIKLIDEDNPNSLNNLLHLL